VNTVADDAASSDRSRPDETGAERSDRNWVELLQELRVTQTGVQILYGFLLILPFQARFADLGPALVAMFVAAVMSGTLSIVLLVAPVTVHRALFRRHAKRLAVDASDLLARAGLACLALTLALVSGLAFGVVLGESPGILACAVTGVTLLLGWLFLPLWLRTRGRDA
jgi:hypothetical protein